MAERKNCPRKDQYRRILENADIRFEDCRISAFMFEYPLGPERFHLHLMNAIPRPDYFLFDCIEQIAQIIFPNDESTAMRIQELAEMVGGHKTTPNLK